MTDGTTRPRSELAGKIGELARETGSSPEELEAAAREYAEYERWKEAKVQEALDELEAGAPTYSHEEVFAEMNAILEERIRAGWQLRDTRGRTLPNARRDPVDRRTRRHQQPDRHLRSHPAYVRFGLGPPAVLH